MKSDDVTQLVQNRLLEHATVFGEGENDVLAGVTHAGETSAHVWKRGGEKVRKTDRQRHRPKDSPTETQTNRDTGKQRHIQRHRDTDRQRLRYTDTKKERRKERRKEQLTGTVSQTKRTRQS